MITKSHYQERASASDFKDAVAQRFGHRDVVVIYFTNDHQKLPPVNHQEKCLVNGICGIFDKKSNYFGPVMPEKIKRFENLDERVIKYKKRVSINRSKTASL